MSDHCIGTRLRRMVVAAALLAWPGAGPLIAQAPPAPQLPPGRLADSLAWALTLPTVEELRRTLEQAASDEERARVQIDETRAQANRTQYLLDIQKSERETVDKRLSLAKKEKREADQKTLEAERRGHDVQVRILERWRDVHDAGSGMAEATRNAARERRKVAEAERLLLDVRDSRARARAGDSTVVAGAWNQDDENLARQVRRVLEARRSEANAVGQLADRERDLSQKHLDLLEARLAARPDGK